MSDGQPPKNNEPTNANPEAKQMPPGIYKADAVYTFADGKMVTTMVISEGPFKGTKMSMSQEIHKCTE